MAKVLTIVRTPLEKRYLIVFLGRVPHRQSPNFLGLLTFTRFSIPFRIFILKILHSINPCSHGCSLTSFDSTAAQNPLFKVQYIYHKSNIVILQQIFYFAALIPLPALRFQKQKKKAAVIDTRLLIISPTILYEYEICFRKLLRLVPQSISDKFAFL